MKENLTSKTGHFHFAKIGDYHVAGTERSEKREVNSFCLNIKLREIVYTAY